jgi:multidrug efflux pump subunit AcrB
VNNGVVLLDYSLLLIERKKVKEDLPEDTIINDEELKSLIVKAGSARLRPVLLTAITTILGLIPLAIGLNIDFFSLFSDFDPKIFFGGDNVVFWGPLAWTVIYGLFVATFLTLVIVPVLFFLSNRLKRRLRNLFADNKVVIE